MRHALIFAAALVAAPSVAAAACSQADLAGTWRAYAVVATPAGATALNCKLKIQAGGVLGGVCSDSVTAFQPAGEIVIANASLCAYSGFIRLDRNGLRGQKHKLTSITLSRDKQTAAGLGVPSGGGFIQVTALRL